MEKARNIEHKKKAECFLIDLGLIEYKKAHDIQLYLVEAKRDGRLEEDVFLFLEHPPVFTLGRRGGLESLKVPVAFLESRDIQIIPVERGGNITYHGPGQLVVYPIMDLRGGGWRIPELVEALEEVMILTVADWGIRAERNRLNRGAWVGKSKVGSIGIAVRRSVSFHGLALNANTNLEPFSWIHACGLHDVLVTSMKQVLGKEISMQDLRHQTALHLGRTLGVALMPVTLEFIENLLDRGAGAAGRKAS